MVLQEGQGAKIMKRIYTTLLIVILNINLLNGQEMPEANKKAYEDQLKKIEAGVKAGPYKADWEDLEKHQAAPEWFLDGKFGIYFHWGVYTVAGVHAWYMREIHLPEDDRKSELKYHKETYGDPSEYPYHNFVPEFNAKHFDAEEWAELFKNSGAKFAGPCAVHHDTFAMWDSKITPWCAGKKGPGKDILGQLEKAVRKQGMKLIASFHNERSQSWIPRVEGTATVSTDPELRMLYANYSVEEYSKIFLAELGEVIDKYQPDLIWFDGGMTRIRPDSIHAKFLAYYFNSAEKWGREVVVNTKHHNYPTAIAVEDHERGGTHRLTKDPWLSDDTIGSGWMYRNAKKPYKVRPVKDVIRGFMSIISKNGCLLFNVAPTTDGRITDDQREVLKEIGNWLKINGEAVYCTRPWEAFGEGPNRRQASGKGSKSAKLSNLDVRYTRSKDNSTLYATIMGWNKEFSLKSIKVNNKKGNIELLGHGKVDFEINKKGQINLEYPDLPEKDRPCKYAYCFKITGFDHELHPDVDETWQMVDEIKALSGRRSVIGRKIKR